MTRSSPNGTDHHLILRSAAALVAILATLACGENPVQDVPSVTPQSDTTLLSEFATWTFGAEPPADDGLATVTQKELRAKVRFLASEELGGRESGQPGAVAAATWIAEGLRQAGLAPGAGKKFLQPFTFGSGDVSTANVVARLRGSDDVLRNEVIVVGAHYDHLGWRDGELYPGADDNASGTAALIEVAEALSALRTNLPRTILFVAFSGEEEGLLGSRHFVDHPTVAFERIVYMVNLDMIGHLEGHSLRFFNAREIPALAELALSLSTDEGVTADTRGTSGGSDHVPFRAAGVPVVFLHTGLTSTYHSPEDRANTLDYPGMTAISRVTVRLVWNLAHGQRVAGARTPVRFDALFDHDARPFLRP